MTSETWIIGSSKPEKVVLGASVRQRVSEWGPGHVEAEIYNLGGRPTVKSARAYPLTDGEFDATSRLQAALDLAI